MADTTKSKEGSGKGPSFLFALGALGLTVLIVFGAFVLPRIVVDLIGSADPINVAIKRGNEACANSGCLTDLMSEIFAVGEAREAVESRLAAAGFSSGGDGHFSHLVADAVFGCDFAYYVDASFDRDDRLTAATGMVGTSGCF